MKETTWKPVDASDAQSVPVEVQRRFDEVARAHDARSEIVWGEHCSECSFPTCQSACAFYTPMADLICQRFESGIEDRPTAAGTPLQHIRFRKWGKLEGRGNARLAGPGNRRSLARLDRAVSTLLRRLPLPFRSKRAWIHQWNTLKGRMLRSARRPPSHFVIESWTPAQEPAPFSVTFLQADGHKMFQQGFTVSNRHDVARYPVSEIARHVDLDRDFVVQIEPVGDAEGREVVFGLVDFVAEGQMRAAAAPAVAPPDRATRAKVVVWDLDNTLWTGTLAETGSAGLQLRHEVREVIEELDRRGILNSIASKNDEAEALAALDGFGMRDLFLHPQIGWNPKSDAISTIAQRLDLGVDSFVFVDDQAFERGEVAAAHPAITTMSETDALHLPSHALSDVPVTAESRARRALYQAEAERRTSFQTSGADYLGFLRSCDITLAIRDLAPASVERVYELSQRTNQLNFRGTKYARDDVVALLGKAPAQRSWVLECTDRFGDYGVIGFASVDMAAGTLVDFFMSCRVQRKTVENAFFAHLLDVLRAHRHAELLVRHAATARNGASRRMLDDLGFVARTGPDRALWAHDTAVPIPDADLVLVRAAPAFEEAAHVQDAG